MKYKVDTRIDCVNCLCHHHNAKVGMLCATLLKDVLVSNMVCSIKSFVFHDVALIEVSKFKK